MTNTEMKIVCFGDSLTYGYGVLEHIAYPYRLAKDLPEKYPQYSWAVSYTHLTLPTNSRV